MFSFYNDYFITSEHITNLCTMFFRPIFYFFPKRSKYLCDICNYLHSLIFSIHLFLKKLSKSYYVRFFSREKVFGLR